MSPDLKAENKAVMWRAGEKHSRQKEQASGKQHDCSRNIKIREARADGLKKQ